jgi:hypothetical protein
VWDRHSRRFDEEAGEVLLTELDLAELKADAIGADVSMLDTISGVKPMRKRRSQFIAEEKEGSAPKTFCD